MDLNPIEMHELEEDNKLRIEREESNTLFIQFIKDEIYDDLNINNLIKEITKNRIEEIIYQIEKFSENNDYHNLFQYIKQHKQLYSHSY